MNIADPINVFYYSFDGGAGFGSFDLYPWKDEGAFLTDLSDQGRFYRSSRFFIIYCGNICRNYMIRNKGYYMGLLSSKRTHLNL